MHLRYLLALLCVIPACFAADCKLEPKNPECEATSTPSSETPVDVPTSSPSPTSPTAASGTPGEPGTTPFVSTAAPTTTMASTLPPVNMSYVEFQRESCLAGVCTYSFLAPRNDQHFLKDEQAQIDVDQKTYDDANTNVIALKTKTDNVTGPDQELVDALRNQIIAAQNQLNLMKAQVAAIVANTQSAKQSLATANIYLNNMDYSDSCFVNCNQPPTPPPPTTTPTTPPTTTQSPCAEVTCPGDSAEPGDHCEVKQFGDSSSPFCTNCEGNLDGFQFCQESACSSEGVNAQPHGMFVSPGFNTTGGYGPYPSNKLCIWKFDAEKYAVNKTTVSLVNLSSGSYLTIYQTGNSTGTPITSSTNGNVLNRIFSGFKGPIEIHLQTEDNVPSTANFQWNFS